MHFTVLSTSSAAKPSPWNQQNSPQIMICFDDLIVDFCGFFWSQRCLKKYFNSFKFSRIQKKTSSNPKKVTYRKKIKTLAAKNDQF